MSDLAPQDPFWQAPQCPSKLSLAFLVSRIYTAEITLTVQSLIELQQHLNAPVLTDTLLRELDSLLEAITYRLERATPCFFTAEKGEGMTPEAIAKAQLFDHLLALCLIIFGKEETAQVISEEPWRRLLECITHMVVEEDIRPYNILVNRMLRLSDRNLTFRVLLTLLERTALELSPYDEPDSSAVKFVGLVMRYIWRRTKSIAEDVRDGLIQVDQLLQECHLFIAASPPAIWVRRTDEQYPLTNQPLRTVKTILHELAGELGIKVLDICRQAIPAAGNKGYIYLYLERVLEEGNARVAAAIASDTPMDKANAAAVTTITIVTNEIANSKQNNSAVSSTSQAVEIDARATVTTNDDVNEAPLPTIATTAALAVASGMTANADIIPMPNDEKKTIENNNNNNNEEEEEREGEEDEHDGNEENAHHEEANSKEAEEDESLTRKSAAFLLQDGTHYKFPGRPGFTILHKSRRRVLHARPPSARKSTTPVKNDSPVPIATTITVTATPLAEVAPPAPFIAATTAPAADSTTQIPIHPSDFRPDPELCLKLTSMFAKLFIAEEREEGIKELSELRLECPLTDDFIRSQLSRSTPAFKEEIVKLLQEAFAANQDQTVPLSTELGMRLANSNFNAEQTNHHDQFTFVPAVEEARRVIFTATQNSSGRDRRRKTTVAPLNTDNLNGINETTPLDGSLANTAMNPPTSPFSFSVPFSFSFTNSNSNNNNDTSRTNGNTTSQTNVSTSNTSSSIKHK